MPSKLVQAPWRQDAALARGSLAPQLLQPDLWQRLKAKGIKRFVIATCNWEYLLEHLHCLKAYDQSSASIPMLCGVYCSSDNKASLEKSCNELSRQLGLKKTALFLFGCEKLDWVQSQQSDSEIRNDYLINYIRCARFVLLKRIWKALGIGSRDYNLSQSASYVIDLDNVVKADFDRTITGLYGANKAVLSWNSKQSPSPDFPATLSGMAVKRSPDQQSISYTTNHPYKILKAGFCAFSPSGITDTILGLIELYSIGDDISVFYLRLFTFYFSDQVAILLALMDTKQALPRNYYDEIRWIDIASSKIVNLDNEKATCVWYPKGVGLKVKKN